MTASVLAGCLWAVAAAGTAMLPLRRQMGPGLALLLSAPALVLLLAADLGRTAAAPGLAAFASMVRRPLGARARLVPARGAAA